MSIKRFMPRAVAATLCLAASLALAGPLQSRVDAGEPIRIGFANSPPYAYVGEDGKPAGFMNAYVTALLKKMGYNKIEVVASDWAGLVPGLQAGRIDIITTGMYIQKGRCETLAFSEPTLKTFDVLMVRKGNPKGLNNYGDMAKKGAIMAAVAGHSTIKVAQQYGVRLDQIMQLPDNTAVLAAIKSGRADAAVNSYLSLVPQVQSSNGELELTDPNKMPEVTVNWVSFGFRKSDADFVAKFNAAQKQSLGSPEMLKIVAPYGYEQAQLPGATTLEWVCEHR